MAAIDAWRFYGSSADTTATYLRSRYDTLGMFYKGTWSADPRRQPFTGDVYRNARQVVSKTSAIVDCYEQLVYQGDIPTFGKGLPDGIMLAIPIDPQTGQESTDEQLLRAFYTVFDIGRWTRICSLIPKTAAIYGDCLVQLKDDPRRGVVTPEVVAPWKVPLDGLELDDSDNVRAVAIEYDVTIPESHAFGRDVKAETYRYRKEMTSREFRYYKDDKPWSDPNGHGDAVQENPYGFCPAAWFRHELIEGGDRGMGAYERTLMQAMETNSLLSAVIDNQRKFLGAPIGVVGSAAVRPGRTLNVPGGLTFSATTTADEIEEVRRAAAEKMNLLPMNGSDAKFLTVPSDIGKALEVFAKLDDSLVSENPESKYAQLMAEVGQVTGPGARWRLAPIAAKVRAAQRNHDPRMTALAQMSVSMLGFRVNDARGRPNDIPDQLLRDRPDRYEAFRPFTLDSYGKGLLDASILPRDPFPETQLEKAQWVQIVDSLGPWGKKEMGVPEEDIAAEEAAAERAREAQIAAFGVAAAGSADEQQPPVATDGDAA